MIYFLKQLLKETNIEKSFIIETWQGHLNNGNGFKNDLKYIENLYYN